MKEFSQLYDYYLRDLPGLTSFAAVNELRKAAQEFCRRTLAWREALDTLTLTDEDIHYFPVSTSQEVVKIVSAKLNGQRLALLTRDRIDDQEHGICGLSSHQFQLYPEPSAGDELDLTVILMPSHTATGIGDALYARHAEAIAYGARARLKRRRDTPYYDPDEAMIDEARFDREIAQAHADAAKGYSRAPLRTKASFF